MGNFVSGLDHKMEVAANMDGTNDTEGILLHGIAETNNAQMHSHAEHAER